jgi:hypothetical protein
MIFSRVYVHIKSIYWMKKFLLQPRHNFCHIMLGCAITFILSLIFRLPPDILVIWVLTVLGVIGLTIFGLLKMP